MFSLRFLFSDRRAQLHQVGQANAFLGVKELLFNRCQINYWN